MSKLISIFLTQRYAFIKSGCIVSYRERIMKASAERYAERYVLLRDTLVPYTVLKVALFNCNIIEFL